MLSNKGSCAVKQRQLCRRGRLNSESAEQREARLQQRLDRLNTEYVELVSLRVSDIGIVWPEQPGLPDFFWQKQVHPPTPNYCTELSSPMDMFLLAALKHHPPINLIMTVSTH